MYPDFSDSAFLEEQIRRTMAFYDPRILDPAGGFFQNFRDHSSVFDADSRRLVVNICYTFDYPSWELFANVADAVRPVKVRLEGVPGKQPGARRTNRFWRRPVLQADAA